MLVFGVDNPIYNGFFGPTFFCVDFHPITLLGSVFGTLLSLVPSLEDSSRCSGFLWKPGEKHPSLRGTGLVEPIARCVCCWKKNQTPNNKNQAKGNKHQTWNIKKNTVYQHDFFLKMSPVYWKFQDCMCVFFSVYFGVHSLCTPKNKNISLQTQKNPRAFPWIKFIQQQNH